MIKQAQECFITCIELFKYTLLVQLSLCVNNILDVIRLPKVWQDFFQQSVNQFCPHIISLSSLDIMKYLYFQILFMGRCTVGNGTPCGCVLTLCWLDVHLAYTVLPTNTLGYLGAVSFCIIVIYHMLILKMVSVKKSQMLHHSTYTAV